MDVPAVPGAALAPGLCQSLRPQGYLISRLAQVTGPLRPCNGFRAIPARSYERCRASVGSPVSAKRLLVDPAGMSPMRCVIGSGAAAPSRPPLWFVALRRTCARPVPSRLSGARLSSRIRLTRTRASSSRRISGVGASARSAPISAGRGIGRSAGASRAPSGSRTGCLSSSGRAGAVSVAGDGNERCGLVARR